MKKTIAITSALAAASSLATAEIKINEFLSFEGFVDMSYSHTDIEDKGSDNTFGLDQVEIDWLFNFGKVTARVDLEYLGGTTGEDDTNVEQAFVNYDLGNGLSVTAGRYESSLGLEAKEPTGLYQYSTAYDMGNADNDVDNGKGGVDILPQYAQGVKLTKVSGDNVYSVSIQDEAFENDGGRLGGDKNGTGGNSSYAVEAAASIALGDGMTWFLGGAYEDSDSADNNTYVLNTHLVVESGDLTWGAEVNYGDAEGGFTNGLNQGADSNEEVLQALIMANYAYSDCCSVTGRISYSDHENEVGGVDGEADFLKYTLAHNYAVTDNLAVITEVSLVDGEINDVDYEALVGAVEVLFSF